MSGMTRLPVRAGPAVSSPNFAWFGQLSEMATRFRTADADHGATQRRAVLPINGWRRRRFGLRRRGRMYFGEAGGSAGAISWSKALLKIAGRTLYLPFLAAQRRNFFFGGCLWNRRRSPPMFGAPWAMRGWRPFKYQVGLTIGLQAAARGDPSLAGRPR